MKNKALTKTTQFSSLQPLNKNTSLMPGLGNLQIKKLMIADMGDGAHTDHCVKVKPNRSGQGFVLKCTDRNRLTAAIAHAGIDPRLVKIVKGRKHFVAFVQNPPTAQRLMIEG